jgi:hypothetical protein
MATGAPNPAAPSMKAPKQNATSSKSDAVAKTRHRQDQRHLEKYDSDQGRCRRATNGAPVRLDLQPNQQSEQHKDGQGRDQRRKPPAAERIIDLGPVHDAPSSSINNERFPSRTFAALVVKAFCKNR